MSWQRVRGHDNLIEAFDRVVQRGRLAHAYLLTGLPGIGKRLFAEELARAILCEAPDRTRLEACDHCHSCTQVVAGSHPDFHVASRPEDKLEFPIETMREFCQTFALKSARGKGRVAILDDADDLNEESANCFLKTLEEPPAGSLLLLISTSADRLLPTIVSRCQTVQFKPLSESLIVELLRRQGTVEPSLLDTLACQCGGSFGLAMAFADPALWEFRATLINSIFAERPDGVVLAKAWMEFVEASGKDAAIQRRRAGLTIRLLVGFLEGLLLRSTGLAPRVADGNDLTIMSRAAEVLATDAILGLLERCLEATKQIDRRVQLVLVMESLSDCLTQLILARKGAIQ